MKGESEGMQGAQGMQGEGRGGDQPHIRGVSNANPSAPLNALDTGWIRAKTRFYAMDDNTTLQRMQDSLDNVIAWR